MLGGARSGKSAHAERLVESQPGPCHYLATAEAGDAEMAERIAAHRARRGGRWLTLEEPLELAEALALDGRAARRATQAPAGAVLVDCLTLWLSNLLAAGRDPAEEGRRLLEALPGLAAPVVFVSNEVGLGLVPMNALARRFRDEAGRLNQAVAAAADRVVFVAAGLPLVLKPAASTLQAPSEGREPVGPA